MKLLINFSTASFIFLTFSSNILDELRPQADAYQNQSLFYIWPKAASRAISRKLSRQQLENFASNYRRLASSSYYQALTNLYPASPLEKCLRWPNLTTQAQYVDNVGQKVESGGQKRGSFRIISNSSCHLLTWVGAFYFFCLFKRSEVFVFLRWAGR